MNIYEKLIEIRKEIPYLKKDNKSNQYNYVASSQALGAIRDKMNELKVLLVPRITGHKVTENIKGEKQTSTFFTEADFEFTWLNAEQPEETIICPWYGQGVDIAGEKGVGKAATYAEKYFILKFFNVPTDQDDPDTFQKKVDQRKPQQSATKEQVTEIKLLLEQKGMTESNFLKTAGCSAWSDFKEQRVDAALNHIATLPDAER